MTWFRLAAGLLARMRGIQVTVMAACPGRVSLGHEQVSDLTDSIGCSPGNPSAATLPGDSG